MCGIVGLFIKEDRKQDRLGEWLSLMLAQMTDRGPDSAGLALYGEPAGEGWIKVTLRHPDPDHDWAAFADRSGAAGAALDEPARVRRTHAVFHVPASTDLAALRRAITEADPAVRLLGAGRRMEVYKEVGRADTLTGGFGIESMSGTHAIAHTRMATESAVSFEGCHPFSTGLDLCLVHNGSLSNHNRWRRRLMREGVRIDSQNDSEVAAGYLTWRLSQGRDLGGALEMALADLDGFYTFTVGTEAGFAVLRDPIACKPAVMAETDDYVAIGSEYRALAELPDAEHATVWEPEAGRVYLWERQEALVDA